MPEQNRGGERSRQDIYNPQPGPDAVPGSQFLEAQQRLEARADRLAVDAIVTYCINGRPEVSEAYKIRARAHNLLPVAYKLPKLVADPKAVRRLHDLTRSIIEDQQPVDNKPPEPATPKRKPNAQPRGYRQRNRA